MRGPSASPSGLCTLDDGRVLAWDEHGTSGGNPVVYMHGVPSGRIVGSEFARSAAEAEVLVISPDRPGCGQSTRHPGRRITDWPKDVANLVDHLGFDRYWVVGVSGGGPYALACAAAGDPRLVRTAVVSGIGPLDTPEAITGLYETNRPLFAAAARGIAAVRPLIGTLTSLAMDSAESVAALMATLSPEDRRVVAEHPELLAEIAHINAAATVNGIDGLAYDTWLSTQPWGFDLTAIAGPVDFYAADHDQNVPLQHVVDQAALIPRSSLTVWPEAGHLSFLSKSVAVLSRLTRPTV